MKLIAYAAPVLILLLSFFYNANPFVVKEEAREAYEYLNIVRLCPEQFCDSLHIDTALHVQKSALRWNDTLARLAEEKAIDMARNGSTPNGVSTQPSHDNYLELVVGGTSGGAEAIKTLIVDQQVPTKVNRNHLLGIGVRNSTLADIGVGYVKCDVGKYQSYACIILSKHE